MLADEVSVTKRTLQVAASVLFCLTIAGVVFGFAALKPILLDSGVYSHLCPDGDRCKAQDTRLNSIFIVASSVNNVAALPLGYFLDRAGPRTACIFGGLVFGAGCITFSLGIVSTYVDTYLMGYILMAIGSPCLFLAQFHLSNAFPTRSGLVLGAITGAFDASSLPLCFYKVAYFGLGHKPTIKTFFLAYAILPALFIIQQIAFGPPAIYVRPPPVATATTRRSVRPVQNERHMSSAFSRISYDIRDDADDEEVKEVLDKSGDGIVGVMFGHSLGQQLRSGWWWAMEFMILVHMTRINWYLTTVNTQLIYFTGEVRIADNLTDAFIFLLPLAGLASIPAIGYLLDSRPTLDVVLVMAVIGFLFGVLTLTSAIVPQLIGIGMLVVFRPLFYTAISDYAAKVFGFRTFGTVYGLAMTMSGLFGLILTPLDILTKGPLHGSYTPVNVTLLVFGLIACGTLGGKVWFYTRNKVALPLRDDDIIDEEEEEIEEEV